MQKVKCETVVNGQILLCFILLILLIFHAIFGLADFPDANKVLFQVTDVMKLTTALVCMPTRLHRSLVQIGG